MGRYREALAWFAASGEGPVDQLMYLAPAHLQQAEIYEKLGDKQEAAGHYQRFLKLWGDCDPELRPMLEEARRRLAAL